MPSLETPKSFILYLCVFCASNAIFDLKNLHFSINFPKCFKQSVFLFEQTGSFWKNLISRKVFSIQPPVTLLRGPAQAWATPAPACATPAPPDLSWWREFCVPAPALRHFRAAQIGGVVVGPFPVSRRKEKKNFFQRKALCLLFCTLHS